MRVKYKISIIVIQAHRASVLNRAASLRMPPIGNVTVAGSRGQVSDSPDTKINRALAKLLIAMHPLRAFSP